MFDELLFTEHKQFKDTRRSVNDFLLPKRVICLRRVMDVWHKSICQRSQNVARTLIARNTRHWLNGGNIVNSQCLCCGMVVSLIVSCGSDVAHFVLTL